MLLHTTHTWSRSSRKKVVFSPQPCIHPSIYPSNRVQSHPLFSPTLLPLSLRGDFPSPGKIVLCNERAFTAANPFCNSFSVCLSSEGIFPHNRRKFPHGMGKSSDRNRIKYKIKFSNETSSSKCAVANTEPFGKTRGWGFPSRHTWCQCIGDTSHTWHIRREMHIPVTSFSPSTVPTGGSWLQLRCFHVGGLSRWRWSVFLC